MGSVSHEKWRRRSRGEWEAILERFEASGLTLRRFCDSEGLSHSTFERWRAQLLRERSGESGRAGFVDAGLIGTSEETPTGRLELTLELGGGLVLHLVRG
jgi:hypothetical protein